MGTLTDTPQPLWKKLAAGAVLALLGAATGAGVAAFSGDLLTRWEDEANFLLGVTLIAMAIVTGAVMATRPRSTPRDCGFLQIAVLLLAGTMLMLPIVRPETLPPLWAFGAVIGLLVVQSALNLSLWRRSDELMRRVTAETSALSFWILQTALLVYASAERLGLVETISGWGLLAILMAVYILASGVAAWRRGLS
jgi:hypothetical protein